MKKSRTIMEYCTNCDEEVEMPVVQRDPSNPHLVWVRCPKCNETKPVDITQVDDELHEEVKVDDLIDEEEILEDEEEIEEEEIDEIISLPVPEPEKKTSKKKPSRKKSGKDKEAEQVQVFKIQPEKAREYHPWENFQPGETILHPQWKQYGVVLRVRRSGGGREMVEVKFEKAGEKKLLVNQKPRSS